MGDRKIKKAVIREDLLSITKDFREAIILNQFIYWSERVSDADILIKKENEIAQKNGEEEKEPFYGWMYKTADELAEEVMLGLSAVQIRRYVKKLIDYGYLSERKNPKYKWDRTLQYKVNLVNIARALKKNGYPLSDYRIEIPDNEDTKLHERSMDYSREKNQIISKEVAIPETTNNNYNIINYHSETTSLGDTLSFDNEQADTAFPKKRLPVEPKKKTKSELKELEVNMIRRFALIASQYDITNIAYKNIVNAFKHYLEKYTEKTQKIHPILSDNTLEKIFETLATIEDTTEYHHFEYVAEIEPDENGSCLNNLVDAHFESNHKGGTDWHISHFASSKYLEKLGQHVVEY